MNLSAPQEVEPTGDATWPCAGPVQEVTIPITEAGADIALQLQGPTTDMFFVPSQGLLIDDIRVE